jgi:hypothetical protein
MVREDDPFHLRSISLRLYNAFHELYESLSFESQGCSFAMAREEDRLRVGDDPEVLILRMRQYQKAAHVVNAMRIVLEKGPDASLDEPFHWAQTITGYNPPINPDRKLAPQKDFILSTVTGLMLEHAPPDVSNLNEGEKLKVAGRVLAEEALNLKQDLRSRRRRGEQAEQVIGGRIGDLAQRIALLRLSPYAKPALDTLPRGSLGELTKVVARALLDLNESSWPKPELVLKHALLAWGMPKDEVDSFCSYWRKGARGAPLHKD